MPILSPIAQSFDTVNTVLTSIGARLNDDVATLEAVGGIILDQNEAFTQQLVNNGWRKLQDYLSDRGYSRLIGEVILFGVPAVSTNDPGVMCWLSAQGFFDGNNLFQVPALPSDFTHPLKVWERWSSQNAPFSEPPMEKMLDGLPSSLKTTSMRRWEWRGGALWMPGSKVVEDLKVRYAAFLPDFLDSGAVRWFQQQLPILRATDSLSWFVCAEFISAFGHNDLAALFTGRGESAAACIFNRDVRADERVNVRRQPRSGRGSRSWY